MKNRFFPPLLFSAVLFASCANNSNSSDDTASPDTDTASNMPNRSVTLDTGSTTLNNPAATTDTLSKMDKDFVMKAARGGMMEVEAGNIALQNSTNERIKNLAQMIVNDHTKANQELTGIVRGQNATVPDNLDKKDRDHLEAMRNMKGKTFDQHYVQMMANDHQKDISLFENAARNAKNPQVKAFAEKTLPTLRLHADSVKAISKSKL
ncbi:MAG: DUF4142 domain-containing protein [Chitinophagaceae bacterium]|nr:DUF4142 domain-containing protein [Chitinophagaceae bacterium]